MNQLPVSSSIDISVVSPVYRAAAIVEELVFRLKSVLEPITPRFEIVLVEDGSPDSSWEQMAKASASDPRVKSIKLSRNFGQHYAITAGLFHARGSYVVVMDCDLQEDPRYIPELLAKARAGCEVVLTQKRKRAHSSFKNTTATAYNALCSWLSDSSLTQGSDEVGTFSLLSRKVVNEFLRIQDYHRHYLLVVRWLGFSTEFVEIDHAERFEGKSSYSVRKLVEHAINGVVSQSTKLLRVSITLGFMFCAASLCAIIVIVAAYFLHGFKEGWPSIAVLILFSTGVNLLSLGVVGLYLGKTFEQVKGRPLFIVDKTLNL
ncbi:MAG: glycosyltransferase family 2 protein [Bdellovibrionota bacterium]